MSTSISPLLQIAAPQQASKSNLTENGPGNDFENLLAEASDSAKASTEHSRNVSRSSSANELAKDKHREEETSQSDREELQPNEAVANSELSAEDESLAEDSVELSEAAAILQDLSSNEETVIFQAAATGSFEAEVLHVIAAEYTPNAQIAPPLLSPAVEGGLAPEQQAEAVLQTGLGELTEATAALHASGLASEAVATADVQAISPIEGNPLAGDTNNQEQGNKPQPQAAVEELSEASALVEQSEGDALQPNAELPNSDQPSKGSEPTHGATTHQSEVADSSAQVQHSIEQIPRVEVATAETAPPPDSSASQVEAPVAKAPEILGNAQAEGPANVTAEPEPVPTTDRYRFVQRVSRAFQSAKSNAGEIQLKLSPPELGTLKLAISVEQGVVSAKVETETAAARNILLDNLPALRERLAEQDIRVEKFDVDVGRDGEQADQQSRFDNEDRQHDRPAQQDGTGTNAVASSSQNAAEESGPEQTQIQTSDSLDVSI